MRGAIAIPLTLALIAAAVPAAASEIAVGERYGETVASTEVDGCRVSLDHNPRWHTLRFRHDCAAPLAQKATLLAELLAALFTDGKLPTNVTSLGLGRLVAFPELSARAALAVRASGAWDGAARRFRSQASGEPGALNRPFAEALDREGLFRPLLNVLAPYGVAGARSSVEKVLVGPPRLTPIADILLNAGVGPEEALPFDAQVWLVLIRTPSGDRR